MTRAEVAFRLWQQSEKRWADAVNAAIKSAKPANDTEPTAA